MTASNLEMPVVAQETPAGFGRRMLAFGAGFGIALSGNTLEVAIVRSRPSQSTLTAATEINDYLTRPAAEWGAEVQRFLEASGAKHLAATVLLPREEVIVRTLRLAGVPEAETAAAVELQIETLHPYGEEEVAWTWWRTGPQDVTVGVIRGTVLRHFETLFSEAGIPVACMTFSAAAIHAALRVRSAPATSLLCSSPDGVYGESPARALYSAGTAASEERALAVARAELRLDPHFVVNDLKSALAQTGDESTLAYAAALSASAGWAVRPANLLPADRRATHSRAQYFLPVTLAVLAVCAIVGVFVIYPLLESHRYAADLAAENKKLEPAALRVQQIAKQLVTDRSKTAALDDFRRRPQADLDLLNELVRLLPPQVWTSGIEIYPDSIVIAGEADQAAPLLKILDSSPLLQNSEFVIGMTRNDKSELFRIRSMRRNRTGKTTP